MNRTNHPANEPVVPRARHTAATPAGDSNMPAGNPTSGDTQHVRSQLLKMIMENERKRHHEATSPVTQH